MDEKILVRQHGLQSSFKEVIMTEQQYLLPHMPSVAVPQVVSYSSFTTSPSSSSPQITPPSLTLLQGSFLNLARFSPPLFSF